MIFRRPNGMWAIDFQDARVGRVSVSARTKRKAEASARERVLRQVVEWGESQIVERLKRQEIHIAEVEAAANAGEDERAYLLEQLRGAVEDQGRHTMGAAVDRLLRAVEATREPSTVGAYRNYLSDAERFFGVQRGSEGQVVRDVDMRTVQESDRWRAWLVEPKPPRGHGKRTGEPVPWSPKTQSLARAVVGRLWREEIQRATERAELEGRRPALRLNPIKATERPRVRQNRVAFLSPEEWRVLIDRNEGHPMAAPLALGCLAGLRLMEAGNLRSGVDVVLTGERPRIIVQPRSGEFAWRPKTDRSIREIPIPPGGELHRILLRHVEDGYAGDRYLIRPAGHDRPFSRKHLGSLMKEAFQRAGIKYGRKGDALTPHSLRHTFVSWLVQRDVQALKIARLIGDRPEQVYNTYGHLFSSDLDNVMALGDRIAAGEKLQSTSVDSSVTNAES
jgi:integrase